LNQYTTVISYQLSSDGYITLKVFDLLGREIITLAENFKPAGKYEIEFCAQDFAKRYLHLHFTQTSEVFDYLFTA
jgi:hypothetical protein